jgi:hypothetical protein
LIPGCRQLVCTVKRYLVCARLWASKAVSSLFLSYPVLPTKPPVILLCMWWLVLFSGCGWLCGWSISGWTNWPRVTLAAMVRAHFARNWGWVNFFWLGGKCTKMCEFDVHGSDLIICPPYLFTAHLLIFLLYLFTACNKQYMFLLSI